MILLNEISPGTESTCLNTRSGCIPAEKTMPPTASVFLSRVPRLPVTPCRQNATLYKHTRADYGWGVHLRRTSCLNISRGTKSERGLVIMKHGFGAAGVHEIKAKFRQLVLAGGYATLMSFLSEAQINQQSVSFISYYCP